MKFAVYQVANCFAVYSVGDESCQVWLAFFEKHQWWYRGKTKDAWKRLRYFNADFLLASLIDEDLAKMDIVTFSRLNGMMSECCIRDFDDVFA